MPIFAPADLIGLRRSQQLERTDHILSRRSLPLLPILSTQWDHFVPCRYHRLAPISLAPAVLNDLFRSLRPLPISSATDHLTVSFRSHRLPPKSSARCDHFDPLRSHRLLTISSAPSDLTSSTDVIGSMRSLLPPQSHRLSAVSSSPSHLIRSVRSHRLDAITSAPVDPIGLDLKCYEVGLR
jgi:hypothetical protein